MALLGPGEAFSKTIQTLTGRARRLQPLHQGGAPPRSGGESLGLLRQLCDAALKACLPVVQGLLAYPQLGLELDEGLELPMLTTAPVRQRVEIAGAQCLGPSRFGGIRPDRPGFGIARSIIECGESSLCLTNQRLDQRGGHRLRIVDLTVGTGTGLLGQLGQPALVRSGRQSSHCLLGSAAGCLLGVQVRPYPGCTLGCLETRGIIGILLGAVGQPLILLHQGPTPPQEVVEPLGLLTGGLSPGEHLPSGLGTSIGLLGTVT